MQEGQCWVCCLTVWGRELQSWPSVSCWLWGPWWATAVSPAPAHTLTHSYTHTLTHSYTHSHTHTHTLTHSYTHTHTLIHIHINYYFPIVYTPRLSQRSAGERRPAGHLRFLHRGPIQHDQFCYLSRPGPAASPAGTPGRPGYRHRHRGRNWKHRGGRGPGNTQTHRHRHTHRHTQTHTLSLSPPFPLSTWSPSSRASWDGCMCSTSSSSW